MKVSSPTKQKEEVQTIEDLVDEIHSTKNEDNAGITRLANDIIEEVERPDSDATEEVQKKTE